MGIAVDVTHATDNPGKKQVGEASLGKGPTISFGQYQPRRFPDAGGCGQGTRQTLISGRRPRHNRHGCQRHPAFPGEKMWATGLIGVPNRYMHTQVEVVSLSDLENGAALLAEMILKIGPDTDFTPR